MSFAVKSPEAFGSKPLDVAQASNRRCAIYVKRLMDIFVALVALFLFSPLMILIFIAMKVSDPGPTIFRHVRVGKEGKRFECLKFRTMVVNADRALKEHLQKDERARREWDESQKLTNDPRITNVGYFLRKTSLDELPQLINVLKGDMSIVGPRPIVDAEMCRYGDNIKYYLAARPGITGLWQVSGRSNCSYAERVAIDTKYVRSWTIGMDISIMFRTVPAVLSQSGSC